MNSHSQSIHISFRMAYVPGKEQDFKRAAGYINKHRRNYVERRSGITYQHVAHPTAVNNFDIVRMRGGQPLSSTGCCTTRKVKILVPGSDGVKYNQEVNQTIARLGWWRRPEIISAKRLFRVKIY